MKERPILFSAPMVNAILEDRKTQTRRVVKFKKPFDHSDSWKYAGQLLDKTWMFTDKVPPEQWANAYGDEYLKGNGKKCPYGKPGDRLWVRETFLPKMYPPYDKTGGCLYKADGDETPYGKPWKPSIHMFRWASRINLEITDIRVEKSKDITLADAIAEGFGSEREFNDLFMKLNPHLKGASAWVWVVEFRRV